jgi:hypothetical protein
VRSLAGVFPLPLEELRELVTDVANWLDWDSWDDPAGGLRLAPSGAMPLRLVLVAGAVEDVPVGTRVGIECEDQQEALARVLLDEIQGAIQRRTDIQGKAT